MKSIVIFFASLAVSALAQGPLNPPTMKTLGQISDQIAPIRADASIGITAAPFTISASGNYYLKNNISVASGTAITIDADNVTLDLNGFTISSTAGAASGTGVNINGVRRNIRVKNGFISGTTTVAAGVFSGGGFNNGIFSTSVASRGIFITGVHVSGVGGSGISLADADVAVTIVEQCTVDVAGNFGIVAQTVNSCTAVDCGGAAIWATTVSGCIGTSVGTDDEDDGIRAAEVANSRGTAGAGRGINATGNVTHGWGRSTIQSGIRGTNISNSSGEGLIGSGISGINVTNCRGSGGLGASIFATGTASFCHVQKNAGVAISAAIAIGCTVDGGGTVSSPSKHLGTP